MNPDQLTHNQLLITLNNDKTVTIAGGMALNDKGIAYAMCELAKDAIRELHAQHGKKIQVAQPGQVPAAPPS